ncbi:hypothetical protein ASC80_20775 [Afipia sp. Root123D2]|uniref:DUF445 domain-containing protein n=1 Tax=Afipia sp. Root123D2 TaxID=1736436 RepID=UPI0006FC847F|nr:DUF445 family protein [Afipia sp. Root123D2]KQW18447.1 hypothetical protein ASC80_20775 [Afipia sp. Root123D2]
MADSDFIELGAEQGDDARAAELRRIKALATLVLAACLATLIVAKFLQERYPAFGFVAAFAEAAAIGGLADWYAVVALFRRPLGLPIPHTAIIQKNQHRIADKLGEFIETHFLSASPVEAKLREVDFASFIADWLRDRKRSSDLARFVLRLLPEALNAAESSGLKTYLARRIASQINAINLAPLAAGTLRSFIKERRHQGLLDDLLLALHETLNRPDTMTAMREKIRDELPTLLKLYRADKFLLKKIAASATSFLDDVRADPDHPFRGEFDRALLSLADRLTTEPVYAARLDDLKRDFLARPELADLAGRIWSNVQAFIEANARGDLDVLRHHLTNMFVEAGSQLADDTDMRAEINGGIVVVLRSFIADQKSGVTRFIADQVKAWDMGQLIKLIEINIGRDLQYIRFNGTLIGGLAGLALYTLEVVIRAL